MLLYLELIFLLESCARVFRTPVRKTVTGGSYSMHNCTYVLFCTLYNTMKIQHSWYGGGGQFMFDKQTD